MTTTIRGTLETGGARRFRVLTLDGGGIRGVITAVWLRRLEEKLGGPVAEHFDLIAGTSTGSLLACGVGLGIPAARIVDLYKNRGREVFPPAVARFFSRVVRTFDEGLSAPRYDGKGLEAVLKITFGDKLFGQLKPKTLVTSYNTLARTAVVFKSWLGPWDQVPVWEVCRSSSAAPVYFPAHVTEIDGAKLPLIDGGVVANNPTVCAIAEAVKMNGDGNGPGLSDFVVASFGTGELTRPIDVGDARSWGAVQWALPIIDVLFDGAADATHYCASQLVPDGRYFRFQTPLHEAYDDMDNADATNVNALITAALRHLDGEGGAAKLDALARLV
jgi:uncharacterized protein